MSWLDLQEFAQPGVDLCGSKFDDEADGSHGAVMSVLAIGVEASIVHCKRLIQSKADHCVELGASFDEIATNRAADASVHKLNNFLLYL